MTHSVHRRDVLKQTAGTAAAGLALASGPAVRGAAREDECTSPGARTTPELGGRLVADE